MLSVAALIDNIVAEIPEEYVRRENMISRLRYVKEGSFYQAPECLYLSMDDIYLIIKGEILKYFPDSNYPDWVSNVLAIYWEGEELL